MVEPYKRAVGEPAGQGYRQLPSVGNTRGPELKTIVYAGVGIVLGILVGTVAADGSLHMTGALASQPLARTVAANSAPVNPATVTSARINPVPAVPAPLVPAPVVPATAKTVSSAPVPANTAVVQAQSPAVPVQIAAIPVHAAAVPTAAAVAPLQVVPRQTPPAQVASLTPATQASVSTKPSPMQTVSAVHKAAGKRRGIASRRAAYAHKHRSGRRLASWRRHLSRRISLTRHKLHLSPKADVAAAVPHESRELRPIEPVISSAFTVEGEVTVSSFDSSAGVIDTYEGETFALDKTLTASNNLHGDDIPSSLHYRCDQFRNCSLILDGQYVPNVRRTR